MTEEKRLRIQPLLRQRSRELRKKQTSAEQKLWLILRDRRLDGIKFRRQHPIGWFIADFYCAEARLVIEIDGDIHAAQKEYDEQRTEWLEEHGYRVIRFRNDEVVKDAEAVMEEILRDCR